MRFPVIPLVTAIALVISLAGCSSTDSKAPQLSPPLVPEYAGMSCQQLAAESHRLFASLDTLYPAMKAESRGRAYWISAVWPQPTPQINGAWHVKYRQTSTAYGDIAAASNAKGYGARMPDIDLDLMRGVYGDDGTAFNRKRK